MAVTTNGRRITRDDLQQAFSQVLGEGEAGVGVAVPRIAVVAGTVVLAVLTLTYLSGRRRGRKQSAVLEIRRL